MTEEPDKVTVVVAHHLELVRLGLGAVVTGDARLRLVRRCATGAEVRTVVESDRPDVVVAGIALGDESGLDTCLHVRRTYPSTGVVLVGARAGSTEVLPALEAGASAYVALDVSAVAVVNAVLHAAAEPGNFSAGGLAIALASSMSAPPRLSRREQEMLRFLASDRRLSDIARAMFVSESTARTHATALYRKLGAHNRAQAVLVAVRSGLLDDGDDVPGPGS